MKRYLFLLYGIVAYLIFSATILYAIGFTGNLVVPKSIDGAQRVSLAAAITINTALLFLFAVLIRLRSKKIPQPIQRSTFVLLGSCCLALLMWLWQPMGGTIWAVTGLAGKGFLQFFFFLGWGLVFISTLLVNHFDLFGMRQVWLHFNNQPYEQLPVRTPLFYRFVRHPLYLGFIMAFWCTPVMTTSHLLFAIVSTGYILTTIQFEERDLVTVFFRKIIKEGM